MPTLSGVTLGGALAAPAVSLGANVFCCRIDPFSFPPITVPFLLALPVPTAVTTAIATAQAAIESYLEALEAAVPKCPTE